MHRSHGAADDFGTAASDGDVSRHRQVIGSNSTASVKRLVA